MIPLIIKLSPPECPHGYTVEQIEEIFGDEVPYFWNWMKGQTMMLCPDHGTVVYPWDLKRYLQGGPIID